MSPSEDQSREKWETKGSWYAGGQPGTEDCSESGALKTNDTRSSGGRTFGRDMSKFTASTNKSGSGQRAGEGQNRKSMKGLFTSPLRDILEDPGTTS